MLIKIFSIRLILIVCVLGFVALSCSSRYKKVPQTGNRVLDNLLQRGNITTIDLESILADTILASKENIMGKERAPGLTAPAILDRAVDLAKIGDTLYVADSGQQCIWVMDSHGQWIRRVGQAGNGPGEFARLTGIDGNSKYIYTFDRSNARIQIFDHQLTLVKSLDYSGSVNSREIAVNDQSMYLLADYTEQHNLIERYNAVPPNSKLDSFGSPIIPYGRQPLAYNNYVLSVNNSDHAAMAFTGLPYVFLYDHEQNVEQIFFLDSSLWKQIRDENPSVAPVKQASMQNSRVRSYILHLHFSDSGDLYIRTQDGFYSIGLEDGVYRLHKVWRFITNEKLVEHSQGPIRVPSEAMYIKDDTVYFASGFTEYIYRFALNGALR